MQGGSFVAATASPPIQSTRSIAMGSWKNTGMVDRQLSLDRSVVGMPGSFTHGPSSHQVPVKTASSSAPWTPAPPRSPRQRTHSPLRWKGPTTAASSAMVLTRDAVVTEESSNQDRVARKSPADASQRVPFLSIPSSQSVPTEKTPKRSSSPGQRMSSPSAMMRRTSAKVLGKDDEIAADPSTDRLLSTSVRSPIAARPAPRIASWQQTGKSSTTATTSPRYPENAPTRPLSPFRWIGPQSPGGAQAPTASDSEDATNQSFNKASAHSMQMPADIAMSAVMLGSRVDERFEPTQGQIQSKTSAKRNSRVPRQTSPCVRARTLSPARRPANLASTPAVVLSKDDDITGRASRAMFGTLVPSERDHNNLTRWQPLSVANPIADGVQRLPRQSAPLVLAKDDAEVCKRSQASSAVVPPKDVLEPADHGNMSALDLKPWLEAAQNFKMNTDFEIENICKQDFASLMLLMKQESSGKWTIQTMCDKLLLNGILENLGLPHMPMIFASRSLSKLRERLEVLVDKLIIATNKKQPYDIIVKPTHLSSAQGVLSFNKVQAASREETIKCLEKHMRKFIETTAHKQESLALQSLKPGFIGQPKYKSVVGFKAPLELKVCALWGKTRAGVWWWGLRNNGPAQVPHRNIWVVRDPAVPGELSDNDGWECLHNHPGGNAGHEQAIKLFKRHMPDMSALTETLATALGTPFLRCDFFVGSSKWGVRLNEVAYGCGLEYRNFIKEAGLIRTIDDKPAMSEILRQGMALCHRRFPPQHFLQMLGVQGSSYEDTAVQPLPSPLTTFSKMMNNQPDRELQDYAVEDELCKSVKELPAGENEPANENATLLRPTNLIQPHLVLKPQMMKPHHGNIPTLMMPVISANNQHILHMQGPVPGAGYLQSAVPACAMSRPMQGPMLLRGPRR